MINKKTKYAIKALVYLAKAPDNTPVMIGKIAEEEGIPHKFLEAIMLELRHLGFVASKKGKNGGYYMLKKPEEINMIDIMRHVDGPIALLPCVSLRFYEKCDECKSEVSCGIRDLFLEVRDKTLEILGTGTIADIIKRESVLNTL